MMPSRSALLLLSCMTCLGFARNAVGAQVNAYSTHKPTLRQDLPLALVVPIGTTKLLASSTLAALVAQRSSPTPTQKPTLTDTIPDFSFGKQKPTTKPTPVPKSSKSYWALWWIGTGTVLIVIAGGLLYLLRHSDEQKELIAQEQPPEPESLESGSSEHSNLDASNSQPNSFELQPDKNGHSNGASSVLENKHPDESISQLEVEPKGYNSGISWSSENKHSEESTPMPLVDVSSYNSGVSPIADNKNLEQSTAVPQTEALEVQEPTRLPKINIVDELIKDLQNPDPNKRRKAIWELAQRGDSRAMQPLLELLMDADSKQRSLILEALSQIGTRTLKPVNRALAISLQDENAEVRKNAIRDLTRIYDMMAQVSQLLRHAIDDPDAEVQETARWALTQLSRIRGLPATENLSNRANSKNPPEN
ncbi:HEAT repeat domain-containing protein [Argonema antarcticum]|uniref:HEAT repeat domain-containing protein n=1 Tax=Argonema antarcticum TaxID=2942763 RepID=UPI002010CD4F|nr:HEAT repeat domain-containing protein [Argonema antarcticum]MCL1475128.1 HEAT repeat domain-containing protein [Argonema antarcticum A004/B2]